MARKGVSCVGGPCSEKGWVVDNYPYAMSWPQYIDSINQSSQNVIYLPSSLTINDANVCKFDTYCGGGGEYFQKVLIVNGDITIEASDNVRRGISYVYLISKGKITFNGNVGSPYSIQILGGIYAKNGIFVNSGLTDNRNPVVLVRYVPSYYLWLRESSLSQPTYVWREVSP